MSWWSRPLGLFGTKPLSGHEKKLICFHMVNGFHPDLRFLDYQPALYQRNVLERAVKPKWTLEEYLRRKAHILWTWSRKLILCFTNCKMQSGCLIRPQGYKAFPKYGTISLWEVLLHGTWASKETNLILYDWQRLMQFFSRNHLSMKTKSSSSTIHRKGHHKM